MDLKDYAVEQKLDNNSDLLKAVMMNQSLSIEEIDRYFKPLLEKTPIRDDVKQLTHEYLKFLANQGEFSYERKSKTQFIVRGEIDDRLLEAAALLHEQKPQDVCDTVLKYNFADLTDKDVVVSDFKELPEDDKLFEQPKYDESINDENESDDALNQIGNSEKEESVDTESKNNINQNNPVDVKEKTSQLELNHDDELEQNTEKDVQLNDTNKIIEKDANVKDSELESDNHNETESRQDEKLTSKKVNDDEINSDIVDNKEAVNDDHVEKNDDELLKGEQADKSVTNENNVNEDTVNEQNSKSTNNDNVDENEDGQQNEPADLQNALNDIEMPDALDSEDEDVDENEERPDENTPENVGDDDLTEQQVDSEKEHIDSERQKALDQLKSDKKLAANIKDAMQYLLTELNENKLTDKLPGLNTEALQV